MRNNGASRVLLLKNPHSRFFCGRDLKAEAEGLLKDRSPELQGTRLIGFLTEYGFIW
jgi:hypothetical protein